MPKYFDKQPDGSFIEFSAEEKGYQAGCIIVLILSSIVFCLAVKYLPSWVWIMIFEFLSKFTG